MKRLLALAILACPLLLLQGPAQAGSIDYLSNQSADYIRTFSRNASTEADSVSYNPAGTAMMRDGLHLHLSSQTLFKFYSIAYQGTDFKANDPTPILPAFYAAYKWRHLAAFLAFTVPAGGGSLTYEQGIPYLIPLMAMVEGGSAPPTDGRFEGSSMFLAPSFGAAYELFGKVSVSAAGRAIIASKSYKGSATYGNVVAELDSKKSAAGFGGIFGVHIRPIKRLDIGIRYETETPLEFEAETTSRNLVLVENTPLASFRNGAKEKRNLPAVLGVGVSFRILETLAASVSWNYYFINQADSEPDVVGPMGYVRGYDDDYSNGMDLGASVEYRIIPPLLARIGYNHSFSGGGERTYSDFEYVLPSNSVGAGVRYTFWDRFDLTGAVAGTFYEEASNEVLHPIIAKNPETFNKTVVTLGIGLGYRFF